MGFLPGDNVRLKSTGKTVTVEQSNGHAVKAGAGCLKAWAKLSALVWCS